MLITEEPRGGDALIPVEFPYGRAEALAPAQLDPTHPTALNSAA
jgi:hypothetical protein